MKRVDIRGLAWANIKSNESKKMPHALDRIKYTSPPDAKDVTPGLLAAMFDVEDVVVSKAVYNSAAEGLAATTGFVLGNIALLAYRASAPSLNAPTPRGIGTCWRHVSFPVGASIAHSRLA